jgi:hypothetical protein
MIRMTLRASKAENDPSWTVQSESQAPRALATADPKPLLKKPLIPTQIINAWPHRLLDSAGPPV